MVPVAATWAAGDTIWTGGNSAAFRNEFDITLDRKVHQLGGGVLSTPHNSRRHRQRCPREPLRFNDAVHALRIGIHDGSHLAAYRAVGRVVDA